MCVNTHLRAPPSDRLIERFPPWSLVVIKARDRLLKKFCLNAQHRRGPAEETQEVEGQLLSTRAQKQLCAGVITQRKWSGRGEWIQVFRGRTIRCFRRGTCAAAPLNSITCVISEWGAATRRTWYSLTRVPLVGSLCHCARRLLWKGFVSPPPTFSP